MADYNQIPVFDPSLDELFNLWSDNHVKQGFSWRQGSVSFGTISDQYEWDFDLYVKKFEKNVETEYIRIIRVPFMVGEGGVEIGLITSQAFDIPPGPYALTFCIAKNKETSKFRGMLYFESVEELPDAEILMQDPELEPPIPLIMTADPA